MLTVTEIFKSIQGESTWAGLPCTFVRLTGCPLRCTWCDTAYAFSDGTTMSVDEIVAQVNALDCRLVEITGGEPLAQKECPQLAERLLAADYEVLCETSGSLPIDRLPEGVVRIMDLKCPGSGESARNDWSNIERLTSRDEVKFVIADRGDYDWSCDVVDRYDLTTRCNAVLFAPVFGSIGPRELAEWIVSDQRNVRFQLQMHKCVWPPDTRGV